MKFIRAALAMLLFPALCAMPGMAGEPARRVVSLAPSVTEALFALGAGPQVVGVTTHCLYPPEAQAIAKIGGYHSFSAETVAALQPDLVVLAEEHRQMLPDFAALRLPTLVVDHRSLEGLLQSFTDLGNATGHAEAGVQLRRALEAAWDAVRAKVAGRDKVRTLVIIGREYGAGHIGRAYIAGRERLYSEILAIAGGENAYAGPLPFPQIGMEGMLALAPAAVLELLPAHTGPGGVDVATARADWAGAGAAALPAVKNNRLYFFTDNVVFVPSQRWGAWAEELARLLHPDAFVE